MTKYLIILLVIVLAGCSSNNKTTSNENNNQTTTTTTETKTNTNTTNTTTTTSNDAFAKIGKVTQAAGNKEVPEFTWTENGKESSSSELKGKVLLVNFWATWCGPCIKEMPDLSEISNELKDKDFKMLGLNVFQQPGDDLGAFLKKMPVSYTIIDGNEELVNAFAKASGNDMQAVPTTFIVDKNGKIVETIVGSRSKADFLKIINKYLS
ncbi:MAG TPA: hypothetical protein DEP28_03710 [Bacteroidetes bacterium]|nr:hypothetical protein [Bacteroidota bacterium]HCN37423.1 hypothetical protein [Bacteroidota bacterium]